MKTTRMEYSEHIAFWRNKQETHPGERMKTLQYLITLLLFCFLCGCNTPSGDKSAIKDESTLGQMVIIPQFSQVQDFDDGLAMVSFDADGPAAPGSHGKWDFIDKQGKMTINPLHQFNFSYQGELSDGLAAVRIGDAKTGKWGFIDKQGKMVINPQFDQVASFSDGLVSSHTSIVG